MSKPLHRLRDYFEENLENQSHGITSDLECPVCRKQVGINDIEAIAKNAEGFRSGDGKNVCADCRETLTKAANVFCVRCNQLVMKVEPGKLSNGFEVRPQQLYHYKYCYRCTGANPHYTLEEEHYRSTGKYKSFNTGMEGKIHGSR
jgi:hypothetical protein